MIKPEGRRLLPLPKRARAVGYERAPKSLRAIAPTRTRPPLLYSGELMLLPGWAKLRLVSIHTRLAGIRWP
jgi:hypothetical protein